ncbi:hypothetical protein VFPPC_03304 [Pochonia chlamydosporia 170]|uniref:Uncharacterized protein n=1 Tax=Pochonia chlamydosporia 170 TaxID=1380566 RepID=A0A179FZ47_METCM|nr:hypothetical protein VFPPC_03304 [Pochonia chlamydosporia 170]OAQ70914.1 hypothetical protein VFPPC_03304 [Pochonia chlamydosporia 170]
MEKQDYEDDLRPLADLTSAARERLNYLDGQGSRRLSRHSVLERALYYGRPDHEPVISSPLRQPSWDQETVPTPSDSPALSTSYDDRPLLDRGFDDEPLVLHPPGLERVSPEIWASWYVHGRDESTSMASVPERSRSPLQMLSETSEPDFTNTSFPFFSPQEPIGSHARSASIATSGLDLPPLNVTTDLPRPISPSPITFDLSSSWRADSPVSYERDRSPAYNIQRPGSPAPGSGSEDFSWMLKYLPPDSSTGGGS